MKELDFIDISRNETISVEEQCTASGRRKISGAGSYRQKQNGRKQSIRRHRRKRRRSMDRQRGIKLAVMLLGFMFILLFCFLLYQFITGAFSADNLNSESVKSVFGNERRTLIKANQTKKPMIEEDFLTPNPYSRPETELEEVNNIFVHYTANRGTSAAQNRSYFENLGITGETSASAHFVIGYDGEIIQCLPLDEIGYAVKQRNFDSISIECCYLSDNGKFTDATYESLIRLCGWLLKEYKLTPEEVLRHYDEGGKKCPLYYVENEAAWERFLKDLEQFIIDEQV